jgi:hypothetical protein
MPFPWEGNEIVRSGVHPQIRNAKKKKRHLRKRRKVRYEQKEGNGPSNCDKVQENVYDEREDKKVKLLSG